MIAVSRKRSMTNSSKSAGFAQDSILTFTEPHGADTWRILHNLNQPVIIAVTDLDGRFIWEGEFTEDLNESIIVFRRLISGKAYVRRFEPAE